MRRRAGAGSGRLEFIEPLMPTLVEKPPEVDGWSHEVKFDGYRSQIVIDDADVRIFTRRGLDWTSKYRDLAAAAKGLNVQTAIIDGEIIVLNDARSVELRRPSESYHQAAARPLFRGVRSSASQWPRSPRHASGGPPRDPGQHDPVRHQNPVSEALPGDAKAIFHLIDQTGLEGIVSKRRDIKYRSGPSTALLKTKCYMIDEYELLGVEREAGKPAFALV